MYNDDLSQVYCMFYTSLTQHVFSWVDNINSRVLYAQCWSVEGVLHCQLTSLCKGWNLGHRGLEVMVKESNSDDTHRNWGKRCRVSYTLTWTLEHVLTFDIHSKSSRRFDFWWFCDFDCYTGYKNMIRPLLHTPRHSKLEASNKLFRSDFLQTSSFLPFWRNGPIYWRWHFSQGLLSDNHPQRKF